MLNILITGARGQLGQALCRLTALSPNNYTPTDAAELDITDATAVEKAVAELKPDVIVNCAAYTDVERAEEEETAAARLNAAAPALLAEAAARHNALLIHVSTDYVFDGRSCRPYGEDTPTNPQNAYGRTKAAGEEAVRQSGCRHLILRTGWLYSETGHNFLRTMLRLTAERETLDVVCDQIGTPTYAGDLALAIFAIVEGGLHVGHEGTYHFSNEGACSWYDFAVEIAAAAGNGACRIRPCRTEEYPAKALRPAYAVLDKTKIRRTFGLEIPHWRESMRYCLQSLKNRSEQ